MPDPSEASTEYPAGGVGVAPGARFGDRYLIARLLGRGGMGSVWAVHDLELDEPVALKTLDAHGDTATVERFRREVRLARRVTHRNVARIFDIGDSDGVHYLTMECVEGESLAARIARGPLPRRELLAIASQIAGGLAAAHAADVVHRDLKPGNVLLDGRGRAVITDFGIARAATGETRLTLEGAGFLGTPAYMAPEQVRGDEVDARTDIFAFGVMLFELLTGRLPFVGDSPVTIALARLTDAPIDPRTVAAVEDDLAELALACMAREPGDRVASADDVVVRLAAMGAPDRGDTTNMHPTADASMTSALTTVGALPTRDASAFVPTQIGDRGVAVMPFRYRGPSDDAYLADALAEEIIDLLSRNRGIRVSARGATLGFGSDADPRAVGTALGVDVMVDGAVQRAGAVIRIQARLVAVDTGFQLWSGRFDGELVDVFDLQDRMASQIAEVLRVEIQTATERNVVPEAAVAMYLRARSQMATFTLGGMGPDGAAALLEGALELAPTFRAAIAAHAVVCERLWFSPAPRNGVSWRERATASVTRALANAPDLPETQLAAARVAMQRADYGEAARAIARALAIAPTFAAAHEVLGALQCEAGRTHEGLQHLRLARTLDPTLINGRMYEVRYHEMNGRPDLADALMADSIKQHGDAGAATMATRVRIAVWRRDADEVRRVMSLNRGGQVGGLALTVLGRVFTGEVPAASAISDLGRSLDVDVGPRFFTLGYQLAAEVCASIGEDDLAMAAIRRSTDGALVDVEWMDHCPAFGSLRTRPEFVAMRQIVNARADAVWLDS